MNPTTRRTLSRTTLRLAAFLSGPVMGGGFFAFARSNDAVYGATVLLGFGLLLLGVALWAVLDAVYRFTDKLGVATSDPFGLQFQERSWWEAMRGSGPEKVGVSYTVSGKDVPDET